MRSDTKHMQGILEVYGYVNEKMEYDEYRKKYDELMNKAEKVDRVKAIKYLEQAAKLKKKYYSQPHLEDK